MRLIMDTRKAYKILLVLLIGYMCPVMKAQIIEDKEPAVIEICYTKTQVTDTVNGSSKSDPMILRVGKTSAMFYPLKRMWADSLLRTNYALFNDLHKTYMKESKLLGGYEREYLFRNVHDGETMVYRTIGGDKSIYTEKTEHPVWSVKADETSEILGYQCVRATCSFRGREWSVWFTPEIPVCEGPWKLFGLPGLVLSAVDSRSHFRYEATSISTDNLMPVGMKLFIRDEPVRYRTRRSFLQAMYRQHIEGYFRYYVYATFANRKVEKRRANYDFQETDYPHE